MAPERKKEGRSTKHGRYKDILLPLLRRGDRSGSGAGKKRKDRPSMVDTYKRRKAGLEAGDAVFAGFGFRSLGDRILYGNRFVGYIHPHLRRRAVFSRFGAFGSTCLSRLLATMTTYQSETKQSEKDIDTHQKTLFHSTRNLKACAKVHKNLHICKKICNFARK